MIPPGPRHPLLRRASALAVAWLACLGASPPEIVRVRVPSAKVASFFPAGSDLHVLTPDRFDELARDLRDTAPIAPGPRPVRIRHHARWEGGVLSGRSEVTIDGRPPDSTGLVVLEPWSPALVGDGDGDRPGPARATSDGRLGLRSEPSGPTTLPLAWELRARPGSDGRAFTLSLPEVEVSSLTLDLPDGLAAEADAGPATGPAPGAVPGRSTWRFEAARGRLAVRLVDRVEEAERAADGPRLWLEGPTRVDLNDSPANWRADWTIEGSAGRPGALEVRLDPGLELVDVAGPRVASCRVEPDGPASRVTIQVVGEGVGPSPLTIRAIARVAPEGAWAVPSARPIGATWTSGRTSVRLDPGRVLQACLERSGRRVTPRPGDPSGPSALVFEPRGTPGPVAELTFGKPTADATVDVRGLLRLGEETPRLDVALTWTVERGRLLAHAADLPPGWTPDRVATPAGPAVPWHAEPLSNGATRVHMTPPSPEDEARTLTLLLVASARRAGTSGPLDLPRVRPSTAGVRVSDETWVASIAANLAVRPILGRGLAWIDPPRRAAPATAAATPWAAADLRGALAWRWLVEDAEARVDRSSASPALLGEITLDATIARGRLRLDWTLKVEAPDEALRSIPVHLDDEAGDPSPRWGPAEPGGPGVSARPLPDDARPAAGFPKGGRGWLLDLSGPSRGRAELRGRSERPWDGSGRIPVLTLPARFRAQGRINVRVEDTTRVRLDAVGLTPIGGGEAAVDDGPALDKPAARGGGPGLRAAGAFAYRAGGGRLAASTVPGVLGATGGLVREACLATQASPAAGLLRHRLTLRVAVDTARSLDLAMPAGVEVDRVRREGQAVSPTSLGRSFRVPIPPPAPGRPESVVTLDYRTSTDPGAGLLRASAILPSCSLPCASFAWEVAAPGSWDLAEASAGLVDADPEAAASWRSALPGWFPPAWRATRPSSPEAGEAMLRDLDAAPAAIPAEGTNLGDWLVRLDAGRWPLVVDRVSLQAAGRGPASRIESAGVPFPGSARALLQGLGLVAVPLEGVILIAAGPEWAGRSTGRPEALAARSKSIRDACRDGADRSDRFQSAARWRGEATPKAPPAGVAPDRVPAPPGWRTRRLLAAGWPGPEAAVRLVDARAASARGWLVAAITLAVGIFARGLSPRVRALGLAVTGTLAAVGLARAWPGPSGDAAGLGRGVLAVTAFWLGRSAFLRPPRDPAPTTSVRWGRSLARIGLALLALALAPLGPGAIASLAGAAADPPVVAVFPYDGPPDLAARPDRVVMLLDDYERLARLARPAPDPAPALDRATLTEAHHLVGGEEDGAATVESRYAIEVEGDGPASWSLPVGRALDLAATVDGRPAPLAIARDGLSATLALGGPGLHRVAFRRRSPLAAIGPGGRRLRVPVNRAAFAKVEVARDAHARWVEVPGAAGAVEVRGGGIVGALGPEDAVEVRWFSRDRPAAVGPRGPVEATILWESRASGDLARARLTHSDPDGITSIGLALDPGVLVRGYTIPGAVAVRRGGTADRPEWVAHIDPPLARDIPIEVSLWKPAPPGPADRQPPRFAVLGEPPVSGVLGFRRPSDWSGRLEAQVGVEPLAEANFARAWGALPDDGLTLAGAIRFARPVEPDVATGPLVDRATVRTRVRAELGPGRLDVAIEADLVDRQGRTFAIEVGLPTEFRLLKVEAEGLVDWLRVARDRLRLQFDGTGDPRRKIRIQGSLPAPADSVLGESRAYQAKIPWPRWFGAEAEPGELILSGPNRYQMAVGDGAATLAPIALGEEGTAFRSSYRVGRSEGLGPLRWSSPMARVGVTVLSDLTIDPEAVTWTASVNCEISGGPAEALHWKLPAEWASGASLEVVGTPHRLDAEVKDGAAYWNIFPDLPLWGRARLILRSRRPLVPEVAFAYPEITPRSSPGRGSVDGYDLAIANALGRPLEVAGSPGLQAIDPSRYRSGESPPPPNRIARAYHVTGDRWSLRLRVGRGEGGLRAGDDGDRARVSQAQVSCVVGEDGASWGRAAYLLKSRPGPFLPVWFAGSVEVPWASVDGAVVPALREPGGRWLIPLGDREARRVVLTWHAPAAAGGEPAAARPLALPGLGEAGVPTLISTYAPRGFDLAGGPIRLDRPGWEVANLDRIAGRVVAALADFDRGSRADRAAVLDDLAEFELRSRAYGRTIAEAAGDAGAGPGRAKSARDSIEEASQTAGLDDLLEAARSRVGAGAPPADPPEPAGDEPAEPVRLRRLGEPAYFRAASLGQGRPPALAWTSDPPAPRWRRWEPWATLGLGVLATLGLARLLLDPARPKGLESLGTLAMVAPAVVALDPAGAACAAACFWLGRSAPPAP